ncbi:MAG: SHOCT domain-containing protein [Desulfohalobiaceae bacterium]
MRPFSSIGITTAALAATFSGAGPVFAQYQRNPSMHPWGGMMMGGMGWVGMIFQVLLWILLLVVLGLLIKWLLQGPARDQGSAPGGGSQGRALEILKERYARGEIDKEEFEQKKRDLL